MNILSSSHHCHPDDKRGLAIIRQPHFRSLVHSSKTRFPLHCVLSLDEWLFFFFFFFFLYLLFHAKTLFLKENQGRKLFGFCSFQFNELAKMVLPSSDGFPHGSEMLIV